MDFNTEALYTQPYIQVPFPISRPQILMALDAFFAFLRLPDAIKFHIDTKISPKHRRGELGLTHRDPGDDVYRDSKDFFHFHPILFQEYDEFIEKQPVIKQFLELALPIWQTAYETVHEIMSSFEPSYPGTMTKIFDDPTPHFVLRFLKYEYSNPGEYLAKPHFDSGSFTLAIAESRPGLRIGTKPEDLTLIQHADNQAIFMVSSNYRKIIDTDKLSPGWHDVIQLDETQLGHAFARWAVVVFIDGHSVEALTRDDTHKWTAAAT